MRVACGDDKSNTKFAPIEYSTDTKRRAANLLAARFLSNENSDYIFFLGAIFDFIVLPLTVLLAATTRTLVTTPRFIMMVTFSPALRFDNLAGTAPIMILAERGIETVLLIPLLFRVGLIVKVDDVIDKIVPVICVILDGDFLDIFEVDILVELILPDDILASVLANDGSSALLKRLNATRPDAILQ